MGSRSASNEKAAAWVKTNGKNASQGTFSEAAASGEIIFNCVAGSAALEVLKLAGAENMKGKILIDLTNPLDFSKGMPPALSICNTNSLGEEIQKIFPGVKVVKTLNTMWCGLMVNPGMISNADHNVFLSGNDEEAKKLVKELLKSFGWPEKNIMDLGGIVTARGVEMWLPLWLSIYGARKDGAFNLKIVGR